MRGDNEKMEQRTLKNIAVSLLLVQLLTVSVLVYPVGAEEGSPAPDSTADKTASDSSQDFIGSREGVVIQLEKRMPENLQENTASPLPDAGSPVVQPETSVSQSPVNPDTETTSLAEPEDPFKSASPDLPELRDPFVKYNRFMYDVNDSLYANVMDPIAQRYRDWVNEDIRASVRNVFGNAASAVKLVSSLLQVDMNKVARVLGRVIINTTIGIGGLFDVADKHFHIDDVNEDFGQTLGYYNIPTGPYVVVPFLGPSTVRDLVGRTVDSFLSPSIILAPGFVVGSAISMTDKINGISFILEDKKGLDQSAVDEYESVRDFYHQYREGLTRK